jgi:hypothetical protein
MGAIDPGGGLPGEKILWSGAPAQGLLLTSRDWFMIPFSLLWGGGVLFALFAAAMRQQQTDPVALVFPLVFLSVFGLVGLYIVAGRFLLDAWVRRATSYAVTNKRILISRSAPFVNFTAISLNRLPDMSLSERADGRGTIRFGPQQSWFGAGSGGFSAWAPALDPTPQFIAIENARSVFDQIQRASAEAR